MIYTLSKELEQELIVSAPELQASYTAIVEYLEAINQKEASGSNSQELQNQLAIQLRRLEDLVQGYIQIKKNPHHYLDADKELTAGYQAIKGTEQDLLKNCNISIKQPCRISISVRDSLPKTRLLFLWQVKSKPNRNWLSSGI